MARNLALWSMTLLPGDKYPLYIQNDFTITNAALPEDLADANGRSVVKVTYHPINPALLADADDSDSEIDSEDFDDEDLEGLEDEFELDEDEGFKEVAKKAKVNGAAAEEKGDEEEEEDDEEDEDEDEDEDDDFSDDEPEVTNVICALTAGRTEQAQVNLTFTEGDAVMFEVTGKNAVHLMGNYIRQPEPHSHSDDEDSDSEFDSDEDDYDMYSDLEDEEDNEEEAPVGKITEIIEKPVAAAKKAVAAAAAAVAPASAPAPVQTEKKRKAEQVESPAKAGTGAETLSKKQKKLAAAAEANEAAKKDVKEKKEKEVKKAAEPSKKRTLPSGLVIEDIKSGDGPGAKRGKRLGMRYIGKLTNGKQFDANTSGKPFSFVLGRGEVIKGWDEGLEGMKVGGERKLSIPPQLAYGNQKLPGIPKGSTLNFEVKLVSIN